MIRSLVRITFFIVILATNLIAYSQEIESENSDLKKLGDRLQTKSDEIEISWRMVVITVKDKKVCLDEKIKLVEKFIENFPENNKHLKEAKLLLVELKRVKIGVADTNIVEHFFNRKSYRTKTEWFSMSFCGGNFGIGGSLSFVTLRWQNIFWELLMIQAVGFYFYDDTNRISANMKTLVGVPFFLSSTNRHEVRISTGFSGGYSTIIDHGKWGDDHENMYYFAYLHMISIPLHLSYVFHLQKNFAVEIGASIDFPVWRDDANDSYIPSFIAFSGFRL